MSLVTRHFDFIIGCASNNVEKKSTSARIQIALPPIQAEFQAISAALQWYLVLFCFINKFII